MRKHHTFTENVYFRIEYDVPIEKLLTITLRAHISGNSMRKFVLVNCIVDDIIQTNQHEATVISLYPNTCMHEGVPWKFSNYSKLIDQMRLWRKWQTVRNPKPLILIALITVQ